MLKVVQLKTFPQNHLFKIHILMKNEAWDGSTQPHEANWVAT